jgi:peptidyl-prolyl cis-trans isomerase SurA
MKLLASLLLLVMTLVANAQNQRMPIVPADRVVAVVNNEAITYFELNLKVALAQQQLREQNITPPQTDILVKQVLERLIIDRIQIQYAKETGLEVSDGDLDATVRRIAEGNNVTVPAMKEAIERDGIAWNRFREDLRDQILLGRLRDREIDQRVSISDGEIDNYLANPPPARAGNVSIAHILVRAPEQATPEQLSSLNARAEQALEQIRSGDEFARVAASFSDAPDALSGGVIEPRPADRLPPLFVDALATLQPGEVSPVLRSPAGFHILKLIARETEGPTTPMFKQTRARHILIRVNELVSETDARRKLELVKERLDNGVDFAEQARLYSDDLSAAKGGDLGWLYQGDTVPEFERAMEALNIGEISGPVQTSFGLHLIQVQERRVDEGSKDRRRLIARMTLRERKADEAYQDWLRQQRDQAYVEYRLEEN